MYSDTCTCADCKLIRKLRGERNTMNDLQRLVPEGTTHFTIEERQHRGSTVYAVVAIVPNGAAVPLNGYSTRELAESTAQNLSANPTDEQLVEQAFALRDSLAEQRKKRETETSDGSANPTTPTAQSMLNESGNHAYPIQSGEWADGDSGENLVG
jgi:hypothetical protein